MTPPPFTPLKSRSLVCAAVSDVRAGSASWAAASACCPGVFRLRLPLPWPGVPHCNAWAVAAGDGFVLFDTGMHQPDSMAQPRTGAGDVQPAHRGRAPGRVHPRPLRPLRPGGRRSSQRAGLRAVDAPQPRAHERAWSRTPRRCSRGAWRSLARAACRRSRCAATRPSAGRRNSGIAGPIEPDRDLLAGVTVGTDLGEWVTYETPGHSPVARLPVPARAAPADLRRPPARTDLAVLRVRLLARPGRRVPRLARRRRAPRRAPVPGGPRTHVHRRARAHPGQPRARAGTPRARARRRRRGAADGLRGGHRASTATRSPSRTPTGCSRRSLGYLTHLEAVGSVRRIPGEPERWTA